MIKGKRTRKGWVVEANGRRLYYAEETLNRWGIDRKQDPNKAVNSLGSTAAEYIAGNATPNRVSQVPEPR